MAAFNKFDAFVANLSLLGMNLNIDALKVMLTNTLPVAANALLADITEIAAGNGYSAGGAAITAQGYSQTTGLASLVGTGPIFTAAGGSIGPFQYVVLYDATAAGGPLIGWVDYGAPVTMADTETFGVVFGATILTVQ